MPAQHFQESHRRLVRIAQSVHDPLDPRLTETGEPFVALRLGAPAGVRMALRVSRRGDESTQLPDRTAQTDAVPSGRIKVPSRPFTESHGNPGKS